MTAARSSLATMIAIALTLAGCQQGDPPTSRIPPKPSLIAGDSRYPSTLAVGIKFWQAGWPDFVVDVAGIASHESWGRWTNGPVAVIRFDRPLPPKFTLSVTGAAFGPNLGQPVQFISGGVTQTAMFTNELGKGQPQERRMSFALAQPSDRIEIRVPHPTAPGAGDTRQLGIALLRLQIFEP